MRTHSSRCSRSCCNSSKKSQRYFGGRKGLKLEVSHAICCLFTLSVRQYWDVACCWMAVRNDHASSSQLRGATSSHCNTTIGTGSSPPAKSVRWSGDPGERLHALRAIRGTYRGCSGSTWTRSSATWTRGDGSTSRQAGTQSGSHLANDEVRKILDEKLAEAQAEHGVEVRPG